MEIAIDVMCRICADSGHYNMFQDELVFGARNMKIYIVLNNFIFEKLYGPDEFSEYICTTCCDSLYNSYQFMLTVRDSEQKLRTEGPPPKRFKTDPAKETIEIINMKHEQRQIQVPTVADVQTDLISENMLGEDILEAEYSEEEIITSRIEVEMNIQATSPKKKPETIRKRSKEAVSTELTDTVIISNFSLVLREENEQIIANVNIDNKVLTLAADGNYFLEKWLENIGEASVYSCIYCVKGFSNLDFLLKHISSCHMCLTCFKVCENNKDLNQHMRVHTSDKLVCPFCGKVCSYTVYRQHIKKQHVLNMPFYVGILPQNIVAGNIE